MSALNFSSETDVTAAKPCALCCATGLEWMFSLVDVPLSHHLRKSAADPDPRFNLIFAACPKCGLLQIANPIDASTIYGDGADTYTTAFQRPKHLDDLITTVIARQDPGSVLDVGCNDGALMEKLKEHGYGPIVGVEPNRAAAEIAFATGHYVFKGYINQAWADQFRGEFDTVFCRHVIEHVSDIGAFMQAVRTMLRDDGLLVIEIPDVEEAMCWGSPAILWEEHVTYLTPAQAEYMLDSFGFEITDKRHYAFGGGSIAYVARKRPTACIFGFRPDLAPMGKMLAAHFVEKMEAHKSALFDLCVTARQQGYQILLYGAAPRSVMVVAACGIGGMIDHVVDDRLDIQRRLFPGTTIQIAGDRRAIWQKKVLCLLGVGAENEWAVKGRVTLDIKDATFVSLFPPRDTLASIEAARREIAGSPAKVAA